MEKDAIIFLLITATYLILNTKRELFFSLIFLLSIGLNYSKIIELFKERTKLRVIIRLFIVYFLAYFFWKDPNPFYHLAFFYMPFENYCRGLFILIFTSYYLSLKEKDYFLSALFSRLTIKKLLLFLILMIIVKCGVFFYNDRLFVYLLKREDVLQGRKFYITTNLYNVEKILPDWINEMKKLITFLGPDNVYFCAFENGDSKDQTALLLTQFGDYLDKIHVPNQIITKTIVTKKAYERIVFLAHLRNRALDFLYQLPNVDFDKTTILFFNDIIFSYESIIQLIMTNGQDYDAACGMDFYESFYDTWASNGIDGQMPRYYYPYFNNKVAQDSYINGDPVRMFSCWNGLIAYKATPFKDKKVEFRSGKIIRQSECGLMNSDLFNLGYRKILINTNIKFAYDYHYYRLNKYVYPWTKNLFTYFWYYFKYFTLPKNPHMANLIDKEVPLNPHLKVFKDRFLGKSILEGRDENETVNEEQIYKELLAYIKTMQIGS